MFTPRNTFALITIAAASLITACGTELVGASEAQGAQGALEGPCGVGASGSLVAGESLEWSSTCASQAVAVVLAADRPSTPLGERTDPKAHITWSVGAAFYHADVDVLAGTELNLIADRVSIASSSAVEAAIVPGVEGRVGARPQYSKRYRTDGHGVGPANFPIPAFASTVSIVREARVPYEARFVDATPEVLGRLTVPAGEDLRSAPIPNEAVSIVVEATEGDLEDITAVFELAL